MEISQLAFRGLGVLEASLHRPLAKGVPGNERLIQLGDFGYPSCLATVRRMQRFCFDEGARIPKEV
jgi:hypothetical protein